MYISQALCQMGRSQTRALGTYVYIPGPLSGGKILGYSTGSNVYIQGSMTDGKVPEYSTGVLPI